ncbi:MAG: LUD domain-containing protein, partial [Clostridia bacterium]|nr:LUD domain-containing protein [Clostridia bacterium]
YMRDKFLAADVGVTGCNYGIAETGTTTLVTNEGNGRMVTALPKTQVIFMGMERILPNFECLDAIMQLFVRASVGAKITSYFSLSTGPKKANEVDGPEEQHIIIIDNGRTNILKGEFRQMLRCIRCGACLNICPVYRHITGHGYGSIYPGPMGAVLTPLMVGFDNAKYLPFASTLCGACTDHCPVKIPLHEMLLRQRQIIVEDLKLMSPIEGGIFRTAGMGLSSSLLYDAGTKVAAPVMKVLSSGDKIKNDREIPVLRDWTSSRDMELMKSRKFRDWFKKHQKEKGGR